MSSRAACSCGSVSAIDVSEHGKIVLPVVEPREIDVPVHGEFLIPQHFLDFASLLRCAMRELAVLVLHLLATVARLAGPGGARAVVAESILGKQQLLMLNRSRRRSPNLRPSRLVRAAVALKPSTLLRLHRALTMRKYRRLFSSPTRKKPGPKGPSQELIAAVVDMKQRNPTWGCPRIAQQITLAFGIPFCGAWICFGANRPSSAPMGWSW
jgi:hypothetical protein